MPAPLKILTAYERAQKDEHKAPFLGRMGIHHTIQYWATASAQAKNIAIGFLTQPDAPIEIA